MANIQVYVWGTFGGGDGAGYDFEVDLDDDDYLKLVEYYVEEGEIPSSQDIKDIEVKQIVKDIEAIALDDFECNSADGYRGYEEEDNDGNKVPFDDWYARLDKYVDIMMDDYNHYGGELRFRIDISNGGESFVEYDINSVEHYLISKADHDGIDYGQVKGLEKFHEGIMKAAEEKLEEDMELTDGDSIILDDLTFTVSLDE